MIPNKPPHAVAVVFWGSERAPTKVPLGARWGTGRALRRLEQEVAGARVVPWCLAPPPPRKLRFPVFARPPSPPGCDDDEEEAEAAAPPPSVADLVDAFGCALGAFPGGCPAPLVAVADGDAAATLLCDFARALYQAPDPVAALADPCFDALFVYDLSDCVPDEPVADYEHP